MDQLWSWAWEVSLRGDEAKDRQVSLRKEWAGRDKGGSWAVVQCLEVTWDSGFSSHWWLGLCGHVCDSSLGSWYTVNTLRVSRCHSHPDPRAAPSFSSEPELPRHGSCPEGMCMCVHLCRSL